MLHATYDEWNGLDAHLRVSFRGDGSYLIEVDGISGWNRVLSGAAKTNARARELLRTGVLRGRGKPPPIRSLRAPSCAEYHSPFRAELVLVAEFSTLMTYRGTWTHPKCAGFPADYVGAIWTFVEEETGGALQRFDHERWGEAPLAGTPVDEPDPNRLPCWPGQTWTGRACAGRPSSCPAGYTAVDSGCGRDSIQ